ncbi:MAG: pYEATS domain-containing protein [Ginsengibacter sp.]
MSNGTIKIKTESEIIKTYLWGSVIIAIIIGVIMIALISGYSVTLANRYFNAFGCGVLIAGASISSGGFLGFIFGIPSVSQTPTARLKYNDNLVQISDWLTKIIVGVGLTQLYNIPRFIIKIGGQFQINFGGGTWAVNVAIAIMGYFFVLGFLMIYFWTKTDYSTIMKNMDDDLNQKLEDTQKKLEDERKEKEQAQDEKKETEEKLETAQQENIQKEEDINAALYTFSSSVEDIKKATPSSNQDPQKGEWGGKSENNGRKITALVREAHFDKEWFNVNLEVFSTDPNKPLTGDVQFHLHPSFANINDKIHVQNGIAKLQLLAWGAFTVGVECDQGATQLEIDLAALENAPQLFRQR